MRKREPLDTSRQREPLEPQDEPGALMRLLLSAREGAANVLYGTELAGRAGAASWLNPDPERISGMSWDEIESMYEGNSDKLREVRAARAESEAGRAAASQRVRERADEQAESLAGMHVADKSFPEKIAGAVGSAGALAPAAIAAAVTRNPGLAMMLPSALEGAAETGGAQRELIYGHDMDPLEAADKTKPLMLANLLLARALPGIWGSSGRVGTGSLARRVARTAAEEAGQEAAQNVLSGTQVSAASGAPMSETVDLGQTAEEALLGGVVGVLGESVTTGIDSAMEFIQRRQALAGQSREEAADRLLQEVEAVKAGNVPKMEEIHSRLVQEEKVAREEASRRTARVNPIVRRRRARELANAQAERAALGNAIEAAKQNLEEYKAGVAAEETAGEVALEAGSQADETVDEVRQREEAGQTAMSRMRQGTEGDLPMTDRGADLLAEERESASLDAVAPPGPAESAQIEPESPQGGTGDMYLGVGLGGAQGALKPPQLAQAPGYRAVADNGVSEGATIYNKTGNVRAAIDAFSANQGAPQELLDAIPEMEDAAPGWFNLAGRKAEGNIGGGEAQGILERHNIQPQLEAETARGRYMESLANKMRGLIKGLNKRQREDFTRRMEDPNHAGDKDVAALRGFLELVREDVNYARRQRGDDPMGYIENYITHMRRQSLRDQLLARNDPAISGQYGKGSDDFFNPFAQERDKPDMENREYDIAVLLDAYMRSAAKDIFNSPVIKQRQEFADALGAAGKNKSAKMVRDVTDRIWRDRPHGFSQSVSETPRPVRGIAAAWRFSRRRLSEAALVGNMTFLTAIQPASMANTLARYGIRNTLLGSLSLFDPKFRQYVFNELRGGIEKASGHNLLQGDSQHMSSATSRGGLTPKSKYQITVDTINVISKELEKALYLMSAGAGYHHATKDLGWTDPNDIKMHMHEAGNTTQQAYYRADQLGWQHSPELTALFPFLTYLFETGNTFAEIIASPAVHAVTGKRLGILKDEAFVGKSRARSAMLAAKRLASYFIALWMWEELWANGMGRRPFRDILFGKEPSPVMPAQQLADFGKAIERAMKYEDVEPLVKFMTRYYVAGGAQINRLRQTLKAINSGGQVMRKERRNGRIVERPMFSIEGEELRSAAFGPYATTEGQEYAEDHFGGSPGWSLFTQAMESVGLSEEEGGDDGGRTVRRRPQRARSRPSRGRR